MLSPSAQHLRLLRAATAIIDVRSESEFRQGSLPGAINIPILNDEERRRVGRCYKTNGQEAAIALGHKLVADESRANRVRSWRAAAGQGAAALMCWRGGLRSQITQQWLSAAGVELPRIEGGFKALRQCCMQQLTDFAASKDWFVIGGRTGSGKTKLLVQISGSIDLEQHAHHRGSAFGGYANGQPTPINFENGLACASLQHSLKRVVVEDEGSTIGRLGLPRSWYQRMQLSPVLLVELPQRERIDNIFGEYVGRDTTDDTLAARYDAALGRISRRLGELRARQLRAEVGQAFADGDAVAHRHWIKHLLDWYYDPMYDYQLEKKLARVVLRGDADAIVAQLG